ncbi:MAG: cytoskeleton protein RodZ [Arsenophonus sp.]
MNNKPKTEKIEITIGQRLLQARETLNLSREIVSKRLCLKVCTIREMEEDSNFNCVDPTFLRGYIRSYAKLVKIPEKEIIELLKKHEPTKSSVVFPRQSYSIGKISKNRESWLMKLTWIIIIICIIMIGMWWWQEYKVQKQEIAIMAGHNSSDMMSEDSFSSSEIETEISKKNNVNKSQIEDNIQSRNTEIDNNIISPTSRSTILSETLKNSNTNINIGSTNSEKMKTEQLSDKIDDNLEKNTTKKDSTHTDSDAIKYTSSEVVISFNGECWLEVRDAKGKILFRGIKNAGQKLELKGELPYQFNIGIPANVKLIFKGNAIDLTRFIKINRPANFKLPGL